MRVCLLVFMFMLSSVSVAAEESRHDRMLFTAVKDDNIEEATKLLEPQPLADPNGVVKDGYIYTTPFIKSCEKGNPEMAKLLLKHRAKVNNQVRTNQPAFYSTHFHYVSPMSAALDLPEEKRPEIVGLLLEHNASVGDSQIEKVQQMYPQNKAVQTAIQKRTQALALQKQEEELKKWRLQTGGGLIATALLLYIIIKPGGDSRL